MACPFSVPVDGFLPGDVMQMATLVVAPKAGGAAIITLPIDAVQRTNGYFEWVTQSSISAHFTLTAAQVALIAAAVPPAAFIYSVTLTVVRSGVTITREVQSGIVQARSALSPLPPLIVNTVVITGTPASGIVGSSHQLTGTAYDGLGNPLVYATITWTSSNPMVASVDQTGLVSFVSPGTATIIAASEGVQASTSAVTSDPNFVSPSNLQVIGFLTSDGAWKPRNLSTLAVGILPLVTGIGGNGIDDITPQIAIAYSGSFGASTLTLGATSSGQGTKVNVIRADGSVVFQIDTAGAAILSQLPVQINAGFGCNSKTPQSAAASGGALAAYAAGTAGLDSGVHMLAMWPIWWSPCAPRLSPTGSCRRL